MRSRTVVSAAANYKFITFSSETIMSQLKHSIHYHKFVTYKLDTLLKEAKTLYEL